MGTRAWCFVGILFLAHHVGAETATWRNATNEVFSKIGGEAILFVQISIPVYFCEICGPKDQQVQLQEKDKVIQPPPPADQRYSIFGSMENGYCGVQFKTNGSDNGNWSFVVFPDGSLDISHHTNLYVIQKPSDLRIIPKEINAVENDVITVECEASGARPAAKLSWFIGNKQVQEELPPAIVTRTDQDTFKTTQNYSGSFTAEDLGQNLVCYASHPGYNPGDAKQHTTVVLNITFGPEKIPLPNYDPQTFSGFTVGEQASLKAFIYANPQPSSVYWQLPDGETFQEGSRSPDERMISGPVEAGASLGIYEVQLTIKPVKQSDLGIENPLSLVASNTYGSHTYRIVLYKNQPPTTDTLPLSWSPTPPSDLNATDSTGTSTSVYANTLLVASFFCIPLFFYKNP